MKKIGEEINSLFSQLGSSELLSPLLAYLTEESLPGLSNCLKSIARVSDESLLSEAYDKDTCDPWHCKPAPSSILSSSGLLLLKHIAESGNSNDINKKLELLKAFPLDASVVEDLSESSSAYSLKLLQDSWPSIILNVMSHLHPQNSARNIDRTTMSLLDFAQLFVAYDKANDSSTSSSLGKHGRFYLDIWEESAYLNKLNRTKLTELPAWSDLFHSTYNETFDGAYREWLLSMLDERRSSIIKNPKKKRKIDPIFVPYYSTLSSEDRDELMKLIPPPVPCSLTHPASWSVSKVNSSNGGFDFKTVHPAFVKVPSLSKIGRIDGFDCDLDDYSLTTEKMVKELHAIEAINSIRLFNIQRFVDFRKQVDMLSVRRQTAETVLCSAHKIDNVRINLRAMNAVRPVSTFVASCSEVKRDGSFIQSNATFSELHVGQNIDCFCPDSNTWKVGTVLKLRQEQQFIRHVKVLIVGSLPSSAAWISLEDELLAPLGVFTLE